MIKENLKNGDFQEKPSGGRVFTDLEEKMSYGGGITCKDTEVHKDHDCSALARGSKRQVRRWQRQGEIGRNESTEV